MCTEYKGRPIKFYDCQEPEILTHTDKNEAIYAALDSAPELPETISVNWYAPMLVGKAEGVAENILEDLSESLYDLCSPDDPIDWPASITEAVKKLSEIVVTDFPVWAHDIAHTETINVRDWVNEHAPHWLNQIKPFVEEVEHGVE